MVSVPPLSPLLGGAIQIESRTLTILAGGGNTPVVDRHDKLGLGGGYSPDIFLGFQATNGVYLSDGGTNFLEQWGVQRYWYCRSVVEGVVRG